MMQDSQQQEFTINPRLARGLCYACVALVGAIVLHALGMGEYVWRWVGSILKVTSGAWVGYRISKGICRLDPSIAADPIERGMLHIARTLLVGMSIGAVCAAL